MSHDTHDLAKAKKGYLIIGGALLFGTVVTVLVSYVHLPLHYAVMVALLIATVKATLVACYFMHLIDEKKMIYFVLSLAAMFFVAMVFLPMWEHFNMYEGMRHVS